ASGNMVLVNTLSGCASAAAEAVDSLNFPNIIGTIAGDNTILLVADDPSNVPSIVKKFSEMTR
ncbi:MAG: arginine repressor, partial [Anaerovorax sp.]